MHFHYLLALVVPVLGLSLRRNAQPGALDSVKVPRASSNSVAYFLENNPSGNSIVSLRIEQDGTLSHPVRTPTGGNGALSVNATSQGEKLPIDSLGSQGSVTVAENWILAVNAGSNTVSMFAIDAQNPYKPKLVGRPASTQGEFPVSVTYSPKLRKACVLNGGKVAGVTCYNVDPNSGLEIDGPLRRLNKSVIAETTPPNGPPGSAAQVLFNPASSAVFATIKSRSATAEGSLVAWPVIDGTVSSAQPIVNRIPGIVFDFGFMFIRPNTIFLSDPSFGSSLLTVKSDFTVTEIAHTAIPNQKALCWTQYEPSLKTLYSIDAGTNVVYELNAQTGAIKGSFAVQQPNGNSTNGVLDSAIKNTKMYSLVATNGIAVVDLTTQKQLQYLDLSTFGTRQYYMGMAVWP